MTADPAPFEERHLARNVPRDFNAILERQRLALCGDGSRPERPDRRLEGLLRVLYDDTVPDEDQARLAASLMEIRLRYLVLNKTLDQSVPPTPIMQELHSLRNRARTAVQSTADEDRDQIVRDLLQVTEIPGDLDAFRSANTLAERAAIAHAAIKQFRAEVEEMSKFFDYKAGMMPKGNQTKFGLIYAINALAALFEAENQQGRRATINRYQGSLEDSHDGVVYTGPFIDFVEAFFHWTDDSLFDWSTGNRLKDRIRTLTIKRAADPDLHSLLGGLVTVKTVLTFMKRAEALR
jgi:hypothetical protein